MFKRFRNKEQWTVERISRWIIVGEVSIIAIVFALFYLVGFNMPSIEEPDFNAPLLTDVLLVFMELMLVAAILTVCSMLIRKYKGRTKAAVKNGIRTSSITFSVMLLVLILFVATYCLGSSEEMIINGKAYTNGLLLRVSDMFVDTSLLLITITTATTLWGTVRKFF